MLKLQHRLAAIALSLTGFVCVLSATRAAEAPAVADAAGAKEAAPRVYTYHDFHRDVLEFNRQTLIEPYKKLGKRDPKWDAKAIEFLEQMAQQFSVSFLPAFYQPEDHHFTRPYALPLSKALLDLGCDDPLVLYCHAAMLNDSQQYQEALPILRKAMEGLRAKKYPAYRVAVAEDRLRRLTDDHAEREDAIRRGRAAWVEAFCGPKTDAERRRVLDTIWPQITQREMQQMLVNAVAARPDADKWMKGVITGRLEIDLAWDSRGSGWANTVTEQGWKGFYAHLTAARDAFAAAYAAAPNLPEPATEMITVAMGGGDELKEKVMDWFELALKAQIDYEDAYKRMMGGPLLPRWGGSYQEMMQLADACVAQPRYDTIVPMYYLDIVRHAGVDAQRPFFLLSDRHIYDQIVKVAEGYAAAVPATKSREYYKTLHAGVAWRVGKLGESRKVLDELTAAKMKPSPNAFYYFGAENGAEAISSVYAQTGPHAAAIADAQKQAQNGKYAEALASLQAIAAKLAADDPSRTFVLDRIFLMDNVVKFNAGEWSAMQTGTSRFGWKWKSGHWNADASGAITGQSDPKNLKFAWAMLAWLGNESGRNPGQSFEMTGVLTFSQDRAGRLSANGAIGLLPSDEDSNEGVFVLFDHLANNVTFMVGQERQKHDVQVPNRCAVTLRVIDHKMTVLLDGKQIGQPYNLPAEWNDIHLRLGVVGPEITKFSELKIRKITKAADGGKN